MFDICSFDINAVVHCRVKNVLSRDLYNFLSFIGKATIFLRKYLEVSVLRFR